MRQTSVMTGTPREDLTPIVPITPFSQKLRAKERPARQQEELGEQRVQGPPACVQQDTTCPFQVCPLEHTPTYPDREPPC